MTRSLPDGAECLFDENAVRSAYDSLAQRLEAALPSGEVLMLTVMTGGLFPAVELASRLDRSMQIDYVHATRDRGAIRGGEIEWVRWPKLSDSRRTILLVDDIFDEGNTLAAVRDRLSDHHDVITAVLARKLHDRGLPRDWVDHYGLDVPDRYVFGCGMDYQEHWRELPAIWALPESTGAS